MARIEKIVIVLFLLFLPSQLGYHLWPDWSFMNGVRVDYLSPTLYLTDFLFVGMLVLGGKRMAVTLRSNGKWLMSAVFLFGISLLVAVSPALALYWELRISQAVLLTIYIYSSRSLFVGLARKVFPATLLWVSVLACWQFLSQGSLGGLWYWVGERTFSVSTPGIARVFIDSVGFVLRPYATLPHPNALAGFLLLGVLVLLQLNSKTKTTNLTRIVIVVSALTLGLTLSRTALATFLIVVLIGLVITKRQLLIVLLAPLLFLPLLVPGSPSSYSERTALNSAALETINDRPLFGVGVGNHITYRSTTGLMNGVGALEFQPTHNIFLLLFSETGLPVGGATIIGILWVVRKLIAQRHWILVAGIISISITGLFDHYWLTLLQPRLLLAIFAGLIAVELRPYAKR